MAIRSFRSRALKRYWENGDASRLPPDRLHRVEILLGALDTATTAEDMNTPGSGFHRLVGDQKGRFSVTVTRNWRLTFGWDEQDAIQVDFEDYH